MPAIFDPSLPFNPVDEALNGAGTVSANPSPVDAALAAAAPTPVVPASHGSHASPVFDATAPFTPLPEATPTVKPGTPFDPSASFKKEFTPEDIRAQSVDVLDKEADLEPTDFGLAHAAELDADPALKEKILELYKRRNQDFRDLKDLAAEATSHPLKTAGGLIKGGAETLGSIAKGAGQLISNINQAANPLVVIPKILGHASVEGAQQGLNTGLNEVARNAAEIPTSVEANITGLSNLGRKTLREIGEKAAAVDPTGFVRDVTGAKPKSELTAKDWRARFENDVAGKKAAVDAVKGQGYLMQALGLNADELKDAGIEIRPDVVAKLQPATDPLNFILLGEGTAVGAVGKVGGRFVVEEIANAATKQEASQFVRALNATAEAAGKVTNATGEALEKTGTALREKIFRPLHNLGDVSGVAVAAGGHGRLGLGIIAVSKMSARALELAGQGIRAISPAVPGAARLAADVGAETAKGFGEGLLLTAPFTVGADPTEREGLLHAAALGGLARGGVRAGGLAGKAAAIAAQEQLAKHIFREVEQAPKPPEFTYGTDPALDVTHAAEIAKVPENQQKFVGWVRGLLKDSGIEVYVGDPATFKNQVGTGNAFGSSVKVGQTVDATGVVKPLVRVFLNGEADALPHEAFHALEQVDAPGSKAFIEEVNKTLTSGEKQYFERVYNTLLNPGKPEAHWTNRLSPEGVSHEIAAEVFSRIILGQDLSGVAPRVLNKAAIFTSGLLEKAGVPLGNVQFGGEGPGRSTLGIRPTAEAVKSGRKFVEGFLNQIRERGNVLPEAAPESALKGGTLTPGEISRVKPSAKPVAPTPVTPPPPTPLTVTKKDTVPVQIKGEPFLQITKAGVLPDGTAVEPGDAVAKDVFQITKSEGISNPPLPKPRNIRTTEAKQNDFAAKRAEVTNIDKAKAAAEKTGDANTVARVDEISKSMESGNPVLEIEHSGVKNEGSSGAPSGRTTRRTEQEAAHIAEGLGAAPKDVRDLHQKTFVPVRWEVVGDKPQLLAMSLDKVIANVYRAVKEAVSVKKEALVPYETKGGKLTDSAWNDVVRDLQSYAENQSNGYRGDGGILIRPAEDVGLSIPPQNPSYSPVQISGPKADFLNLVQGLNPPLTAREVKGATPGNVKGQILAEVNARTPETPSVIRPQDIQKQSFKSGRSIKETNPLRNELAAAGAKVRELIEVTERINAEDINNVTPRPDISFKAPVTDTIRGGLLPKTPKKSSYQKEYWDDLISKYLRESPSGGDFKAFWDRYGNKDAEAKEYVRNEFGPHNRFLPGKESEGGATMFIKRKTTDEIGREVMDASPEEWQKLTSDIGGLTGSAYKVGSRLKEASDVGKLRKFESEAKAEYEKAKAAQDFDNMMLAASKKQFFTEAIETATGEKPGKYETIARVLGPDWKPPFPEVKGELLPKSDHEILKDHVQKVHDAIDEALKKRERGMVGPIREVRKSFNQSMSSGRPLDTLHHVISEEWRQNGFPDSPEWDNIFRRIEDVKGLMEDANQQTWESTLTGHPPKGGSLIILGAERLTDKEVPRFRSTLMRRFGLNWREASYVTDRVFRDFGLKSGVGDVAGMLQDTAKADKALSAFRKLNPTAAELRLWMSGRTLKELAPRGGGLSPGQLLPSTDFARDLDPLKSAAIRTKGGNLFVGSWHGEALDRLARAVKDGTLNEKLTATVNPNEPESAYDKGELTDGFVTESGKFLDRQEAFKHAESINQIDKDYVDRNRSRAGSLESEDFKNAREFLPGKQTEDALRRGFLPDSKAAKPKPDAALRTLASRVATEAGIDYKPSRIYAPLNPELGKRLAEFYDKAKSDPSNPAVVASYAALADETMKQYRALVAAGYELELYKGEGEPYKSSGEAIADIRDNKHLFVLPTEDNFEGTKDSPMLAKSGVKGLPTVNDVFRGVHDFFGHAKEGYQFGPRGEFNAWRAHSEMYSPEAQGALAAEAVVVPAALIDEARGESKVQPEDIQKKKSVPGAIHAVAVRLDDGTIVTGPIHAAAISAALERDPYYQGGFEDGFLTNDGKFLTRKEAQLRAEDIQQVPKGVGLAGALGYMETKEFEKNRKFLPRKKSLEDEVAETDYSKYNVPVEKKPSSGALTGWILPDQNFEPLAAAYHEQFLADNAKSLNKRFGTTFTNEADVESRLQALNNGFVRIRGGFNGSGSLNLELNARYFKNPTKKAIESYLADRADDIDVMNVSLLNDKGRVVDSGSVKVHELEGASRAGALLKTLDDLRPSSGKLLPGKESDTLPGLNLPSEEKAQQQRVRARVANSQDKFPEALKLQYQKDDAGKFVLGEDGKPKPQTVEYNLMDSPLEAEAAKGLKGPERQKALEVALGKKLVTEGKAALKDPRLSAGTKWYSTARTRLKGLFGEDSKFFTELLGATSARTPVEVNYRFALDAYNQFKQGKFDDKIRKYRAAKTRWDQRQIQDFLDANPKNQNPNRGQYLDWVVETENLGPTQTNGKKFGANSRQVLRVLDGSWRAETIGPKTPNFAGNLSGDSFRATVDVWSARTLHRLANEGAGKPWRILPENETGVADKDFEIGQNAYDYASKKLDMRADSLQALLWFAEKKYWESWGWTRGAGAQLSDFNVLLKDTEKSPSGVFQRKNPQQALDFFLSPSDIESKKK